MIKMEYSRQVFLAIFYITALGIFNFNRISAESESKTTSRNPVVSEDQSEKSSQYGTGNKKTKLHEKECKYFSTCEKCTENLKCMWCNNGKKCLLYPITHGLPLEADCVSRKGMWSDVKWGDCSIDFRTVAITVGVLGGITLILICCCLVKFCRCVSDCLYFSFCCCCCCSDGGQSKKEERRLKRIEKQLERQARRQELMLKFGLNTNAPYGATRGYSQFTDSKV